MTKGIPSYIFTKIGFKALQANNPYILLMLILLLSPLFLLAQETPVKQPLNIAAQRDSTQVPVSELLPEVQIRDSIIANNILTDSIQQTDSIVRDTVPKKKKGFLDDQIKYKAKDYQKTVRSENKIYLYNEAEVYYQDTELKAGIIVIDYDKKEVYAGRIKDSTGTLTQAPYFKQGSNIVEPDSIRYNFDTQKALIWNSRSEQTVGGEMNVFAEMTKKENDSVYFLYEGKLTTSKNLDDPEYYIRVRKAKFVPKKKVIAGFSNMYIADVPTPIAVPFAYFPMSEKSSESGLIFPTFGEINDRGYFLQNGGYYFAVSDYFDLAVLGDYYTNGSYGFRTETNYAVRYRFRGNFNFRFENLVQGQKGFPDYSRGTTYNIQWSHSQDTKSNPNSRFSASVNLGSSRYYKDSYNQINTGNFMNNTLSSSVSYSKSFPGYPAVNLSVTATHSQNTNTEVINMTLPTLQASVERIYPFAPKSGIKKGFFQNINFQYNLRAENRFQTTDSLFFKKEMFETAKTGFRHSIPVSTNFKIMKYLSVSTSVNYDEVWQLKTIKRNDYDEELGEAPIDTINGFDRFGQYNFSASLGTTLYGTFLFKEGKKIQAIRHVIRPSVSYGYTPGFDQYYDQYIANEEGDVRDYTRFEGGVYGTPGRGNSNNIGISISNTLEAKVVDKDTTATEPKKITLLNNLNFSTSYNIAADSLPWSPLRVTGGIPLFDNKMTVNFGATLDPYAIDNSGRRIEKYNIDNGGSLFRLTNANLTTSYTLSSKSFKGSGIDRKTDNTSSGGRDDDLFGTNQDFSDGRMFPDDEDEDEEEEETKFYGASLPWDLRLAYSMTYSNANRQNEISNNSLMFSGNVELSPKWKVGVSSGYDFKNKGFSFTQLRFERDLESWRMNFSWTPFGTRNSWYFFIGIKSSMLSDLKWEKRRAPDRNL
ncbi:putative LPS assembly protein LptD [Sinomicrobium oceani]|uniref:putative LPS assembly protein LptD n=1 Tax=Sinomicrobium oceani TaxID=1150368 RepID=UPI0038B5D328